MYHQCVHTRHITPYVNKGCAIRHQCSWPTVKRVWRLMKEALQWKKMGTLRKSIPAFSITRKLRLF